MPTTNTRSGITNSQSYSSYIRDRSSSDLAHNCTSFSAYTIFSGSLKISGLLNNKFIIKDVKIFNGRDFIANGFVVVENGLITDIGRGKSFETDERDMLRISRPQITLIPGLIDAHIHALEGNTDSVEQSLRFGVTTVSDMHNEVQDIMRSKKVCAYFDDPRENCTAEEIYLTQHMHWTRRVVPRFEIHLLTAEPR